MTIVASDQPAVVLFDGVCQFCDRSVRFLLPRDREGRLRFAALQSHAGRELLERFHLPADALETMVLVEGDRAFTKSTAVLRVLRLLPGAWPALSVLMGIPKPLRDRFYDWFAAHRYQWFGRRDSCFVPTPELRHRFLA